jgi:hypothetical protein
VAAELVRDDPAWWYLGFLDASTRRLRVWRVDPDRLVAVVTERQSDTGTSITNAAEMVAAQLGIEYPGEAIEVVEHWPASALDAEHFDGVRIVDGRPVWWAMPVDELVERLGPQLLDATDPGL